MKTDLRKLPGVGKKTKEDLIRLGYTNLESLKNQNPQEIYDRDCKMRGFHIDRCQLYVYRYLVYCAEHPKEEYEDKRWWDFKD